MAQSFDGRVLFLKIQFGIFLVSVQSKIQVPIHSKVCLYFAKIWPLVVFRESLKASSSVLRV